mmetsp:Transcript_15217/g.28631  ORF Transcript_15217/g.28631 Transcript_15217/m.28631 type:complete len:615 (-) Transcript_15217:15-1859(-)
MKPAITANQRIQQWQILLDQAYSKDLPKPNYPKTFCSTQEDLPSSTNDDNNNSNENYNNVDDPFDCSDLIIPETKELVQGVLKGYIQEWRDLDSRLVLQQDQDHVYNDTNDNNDNYLVSRGKKRQRDDDSKRSDDLLNEGWEEEDNDGNSEAVKGEARTSYAGDDEREGGSSSFAPWKNNFNSNRIRLPDFFDYESKGPCPRPLNNAPSPRRRRHKKQKRRQVVSLEDPSKFLDYEVELWKIFQKVPLDKDIEDEAIRGSICTRLLELKEEIDQGYRVYSRLDGHALSRLRKKDLHHWPRLATKLEHNKKGKESDDIDGLNEIDCATVKFEFWRRQVKRFGSDPNKFEIEFLSTQTLLDVHNAIVDCMQDELFEKGLATSKRQTLCDNNHGEVVVDEHPTSSSGFFFIEGTLYSTGSVDYVTPVASWLTNQKKKKNDHKSFWNIRDGEYTTIDQKKMDEVLLGDIPIRLGLRYVHVCHGDVETSIFLSDITMRMKNEITEKSQYPLLHDIWTTSTSSLVHGVGVCEGCHHCPAVVLTIEDELADGGPTPFCRSCYEKLHYHGCVNNDKEEPESTNHAATATTTLRYNNFKVVPMSVLQSFIDLSVGHDSNNALF